MLNIFIKNQYMVKCAKNAKNTARIAIVNNNLGANRMKLENAIENAKIHASNLFKAECRATCMLTRMNIDMVEKDPTRHGKKFIEMYGNSSRLTT